MDSLQQLSDGVKWNPEINEYEVWDNGDVAAWAETWGEATLSYQELNRVEREHLARPHNQPVIDFTGEDWVVTNGHQTGQTTDIYEALVWYLELRDEVEPW